MSSANIFVVSDDNSDDELCFLGASQPLSQRSRPAITTASNSQAIVVDSDSEISIKSDNGEDQDLISLLAASTGKTPPRKSTFTSRRAVSVDAIGSGSTTRSIFGASIASGKVSQGRSTIYPNDNGKSKSRVFSKSHSMNEGNMAFKSNLFDLSEEPVQPFSMSKQISKKRTSGDDITTGKRPNSDEDSRSSREIAVMRAQEKHKVALKFKENETKYLNTAEASRQVEKFSRRELQKVNKLRVSKKDTVHEVQVVMSSDMENSSSPIADALPQIRERLQKNQSSIHFLPESESPVPGVIRFKRFLQARWDDNSKQFIPLDEPKWEWETTVVVLVTAEKLVNMIACGENMLTQWISDTRRLLGLFRTDQVIVMIKDLRGYHSRSCLSARKNRINTTKASLGCNRVELQTINNRHPSKPTEETIEAEIIKLQVSERCFIVYVEKTDDIENWVFNIAADIAIRPYKLLSKSHLSFAPADGQKKALQPTAVLELMLQEIQGITPSAAAGIAEVYPTFKKLMEAYEREEQKSGSKGAVMMLECCEVKNTKDGRNSGRKLNKALSKRVYDAFRGTDNLSLT
ncbi:hypothetical protein L204_106107 [Cryptococcus depauperatus]